jgi:hypothetical protein
MKTSAALMFLSSFALLPAAHAQVHKCITSESVVYRDTPCAEGERAMVLPGVKANARTEHRNDNGNLNPVAHRPASPRPQVAPLPLQATWRSVLPVAGTPISLGMSDLEVLNLSGWGRPTKITRSKANGVWREEWLYVTRGDGPRQLLQFANARLAAIETEPTDTSPQQIVQVVAR